MERFKQAQDAAQTVADRCRGTVIQTGSSLRKEDFTPWSDVDLLAILGVQPEERWAHERVNDISVSVLTETWEQFHRNLKAGRPFELVALKHGKPLKGEADLQPLDPETYGPARQTIETWLQSAFNQYSHMLMDVGMPVEFYSDAYHTVREFGRVQIVENLESIVEGDRAVHEALKPVDREAAEMFWQLRKERKDPPEPGGVVFFEELLEDERYETVQDIESLGERTVEGRDILFPSIRRLKKRLEENGFDIAGAPTVHYHRRHAIVAGETDGGRQLFRFDMETGDMENIP